jgi:hypothetical protein
MKRTAICAVLLLSANSAMATGRGVQSPSLSGSGALWSGFSNVLAIGAGYLHHGNVTGYRGPWCKAFTNLVLRQAGYHPGPSLRAIDALADGTRVNAPTPGDLAVMRGHVTIFKEWYGPTAFIGLGGNQGHDVTEAVFSRYAVVAWVSPK